MQLSACTYPRDWTADKSCIGGKEVTPKDDTAEDRESIEALERAESKSTKRGSLFAAGLKKGDILNYSKDNQIEAVVVDDKKN